jgi:aspartate/methionine/tyrosine aminotransferase
VTHHAPRINFLTRLQGCLISQQNPQLLSAVSLLTTNHTNTIASFYLSSLLTWSQLPTLLALNSERLTESYNILAQALQQWNVDFVKPTHGVFVFAKLARHAKTVEDEIGFFDRLAQLGVLVAPGRLFVGVEREFGWARIRFSVPVGRMNEVVEKLGLFLLLEG